MHARTQVLLAALRQLPRWAGCCVRRGVNVAASSAAVALSKVSVKYITQEAAKHWQVRGAAQLRQRMCTGRVCLV